MSEIEGGEDRALQRNLMTAFLQIAAVSFLIGLCVVIVGPFVGIVIWGVVLAIAIYPLHLRLAQVLGGRQRTSATLITVIGLLLLIGPGWLVVQSSASTATELAQQVRDGSLVIPQPDPSVAEWPLVGERVHGAWSEAAQNLTAFLQVHEEQVREARDWLLGTASGLLFGLLHFVASLVIAGVALMYPDSTRRTACAIARRLAYERGDHLVELSVATIRSVTNGVLGVAVIQSTLAGIGFWAMDVPAAGLLVGIFLILAIVQIPAIIVMVPVIAWAYGHADPLPATVFAVYGVLVALSDNVLKPMLLGRGVDLPILVVLLGAIGGMIAFGVIGLFLGAVLLGVGYQILSDWIASDPSSRVPSAVTPPPAEARP